VKVLRDENRLYAEAVALGIPEDPCAGHHEVHPWGPDPEDPDGLILPSRPPAMGWNPETR